MFINNKKIHSIVILIFVILLAVAIVLSSFLLIMLHSPNTSKVIISNNTVNNSYNNKVLTPTASLIQKNNKLYYKYQRYNCFTCGIYEISSIGSQRILWSGLDNLLYPVADDFFEYDNQIILKPLYGAVNSLYTINSFFCNKVKYCDLDDINGNTVYEVEVYKEKLYCFAGKSVYKYNNGNYEKIVDLPQNILNIIDEIIFSHRYYFTDDNLYFILPNKKIYEIYAINLSENKCTKLCDTEISSERYISSLVVEGQYAIVGSDWQDCPSPNGDYKIHRVSLSGETFTELLTDKADTFNCYNGKLFIYGDISNGGLNIMNIENKSANRICTDYNVRGVFILDDKWIYFQDENHQLFRTNYDGSVIENIFSAP